MCEMSPFMREMLAIFIFSLASSLASAQLVIHPEQTHLSYGIQPGEMVVTWVTQNYTAPSMVEYGEHGGSFRFPYKASSPRPYKFTDGGPLHRTIWIHRVTMTGLASDQYYLYHVGGKLGWSNLFSYKSPPSGSDWSPHLVVYGDMGNTNSRTLTSLQEEAQEGRIDAILHIGDFAYDMNDENGKVGDEFMRQIEPVAAYVPYMTCPGNHEAAYNFSHYKNRFTMPGGDPLNMVYSFNLGRAHIIMINTEVFYENQTLANVINEYKLLENDLKEANAPSSRSERPWILVLGHRPMYCSNVKASNQHCNDKVNPLLIGTDPVLRTWSFEDLFYNYGVDLQFYAHEHSYERLWPVYKWKVCNGSYGGAYHNPTGPVHIVTGSAGNDEGQTPFIPKLHPWSAFHSDDFGYTRLRIVNATHIFLEQTSIDQGGKVIDRMTLIKEHHGAGTYTCHDDDTLRYQPRVNNNK